MLCLFGVKHQFVVILDSPLFTPQNGDDVPEQAGFLKRLAGDNPEWLPAREPASVTVSDVLHKLSIAGSRCLVPQASRCEELIRKVLAQAASGTEDALEGVTIGNLADLLEVENSPDRDRKPAIVGEPRIVP